MIKKTWLSIGVLTLLSTAVIVGCSSKQTKMSDGMSASASSSSGSSSPTTVAANSGSSANLGAASSGNSR